MLLSRKHHSLGDQLLLTRTSDKNKLVHTRKVDWHYRVEKRPKYSAITQYRCMNILTDAYQTNVSS